MSVYPAIGYRGDEQWCPCDETPDMLEFKRLVFMEEDYRELPHRASMSREV